jgi:hypothetical protein
MAQSNITTVRLDGSARSDIDTLLAALRKESGQRTSRDEIVRALVWGVTPAQAAGMLSAYIKHTAKADGA